MADDSVAFSEFRKKIKELSAYRGRGTELISVYITPNYPLSDIMGKLREEFGQAANIKSKSTQKNVQAALEKIMAYLRGYQKPLENGIAVFAGNVSQKEGKVDVQLFSVSPPMPLGVQFYRCESQFVLEPFLDILENTDSYGLVVMDGKEATVALLKGTKLKVIKQIHSTAHSKTHKGGQSSQRYQRLREEGIEFFYKRIGEAMSSFVGEKNFKGIIIGGPGPAKEDFAKDPSWYHHQLKVLGIVDTGYTDEFGLREVIEKSKDLIATQEAVMEKQFLDDFMKKVVTDGLVTYGYKQVYASVESGQAEKILVSEGLQLFELTAECTKCGKTKTLLLPHVEHQEPCECGGLYKTVSDRDLVNEIIGLAEDKKIKVQIVSRDTAEGSQFYATFGGLGAYLRYR
ncbi:peptide chain release factor 1 [Candidatus Micrarchaeota archaeon]|nr:peptide chain release factor 1 [Candidatus Micrarchaeota archaeon]